MQEVSIAKYLKPEAQAEVKIVEEKLQKAIQINDAACQLYKVIDSEEINNIMILMKDNVAKLLKMKLVDIVAQNIELRNQPPEFQFEQYLKDEVCPIVKAGIQKLNQLSEIISELDSTTEELYKIHLLREIFTAAGDKVFKELAEIIANNL